MYGWGHSRCRRRCGSTVEGSQCPCNPFVFCQALDGPLPLCGTDNLQRLQAGGLAGGMLPLVPYDTERLSWPRMLPSREAG